MADKVGDEFDGYITGVTAFGLFIELIEHFVEGLVHVSTMADDYYRFVERAHVAARARTPGKVYRLGDRVTVQVVKVDMERRQVDLGLAEILDRVRASERNRGPRRRDATRSGRQRDRTLARGKPAKREPGEAAARRRKQRPGRKERAAKGGGQVTCASSRHRHGRAHRSRQERARARADRHRSRSAEGRAGARHHHRSRLRAPRDRRRRTSRSSTCPGTSAS